MNATGPSAPWRGALSMSSTPSIPRRVSSPARSATSRQTWWKPSPLADRKRATPVVVVGRADELDLRLADRQEGDPDPVAGHVRDRLEGHPEGVPIEPERRAPGRPRRRPRDGSGRIGGCRPATDGVPWDVLGMAASSDRDQLAVLAPDGPQPVARSRRPWRRPGPPRSSAASGCRSPRAASSSRSHRRRPGRRVALRPDAPETVHLAALPRRVDPLDRRPRDGRVVVDGTGSPRRRPGRPARSPAACR